MESSGKHIFQEMDRDIFSTVIRLCLSLSRNSVVRLAGRARYNPNGLKRP